MKNGLKIRELRRKKGLTQEQVAEAIGTSKQMVGFYENNQQVPTEVKWQALAKFLEVDDVAFEMQESENIDTVEFLKKQIVDLMEEKAKILNILDKALSSNGNFPGGSELKVPEQVRQLWPTTQLSA